MGNYIRTLIFNLILFLPGIMFGSLLYAFAGFGGSGGYNFVPLSLLIILFLLVFPYYVCRYFTKSFSDTEPTSSYVLAIAKTLVILLATVLGLIFVIGTLGHLTGNLNWPI